MTDWINLFATYRVLVVRNDEIVQGVLYQGLGADHPSVRAALEEWQGTHFVQETPAGTELTLVRRIAPHLPERWWLHGLLFFLTALTTTAAGSMFLGHEPFVFSWISLGSFGLLVPVRPVAPELIPGLIFSVPLLGILLGHELGHFLLARRHKMDVSPPYFIPAPHWINLIGTFGAFIRLRSAIVNRAMLLDVGMAGPIASFVLSIPIAAVGLAWSRAVPFPAGDPPAPFAVLFGGQPIWLGGSLFFDFLAYLFAGGGDLVLLHPLAFAGWLGLFVTALNLFPLSQLDGGHILYGLVQKWQQVIGVAFLLLLLALGTIWWGWWLWAAIILLLGRGTIRHPSVLDPEFPVTGVRRYVGWACVVMFLVTFVAVPIRI